MSFCVGNFYFWQTVATLGFCHYLRRLGAKFPPQIPVDVSITVDVGITTEQLLEEKEKSLTEAATKNDELDKQNALLREKVDRLERDLEFTSKDRYELIRKTCTLQNRLGDFQSWPQFREEYDLLVTEYVMMQRQRAREDISHQQMLHIAKEAKLELASANRAAAMSKTAHSEELILLKRERDDARENYETLVSTTNAAAAAATAAKGNTPGDKVLQEENTRLTLALRSQTSLLAKKTSEFERMQSLLKSRSNHSASQLSEAASTILSLEEEKKKGNKRIAKLEKELTEAKEKAEEMEEMYLAVAFADMGKGEEDVKAEDEEEEEEEEGEEGEEGEEEDGSGEQPPTSWLLKQVVAMSKKDGSKAGAPDADRSGSSDDEEEDSENDEDDKNEEDDEDDEDREDSKNEEEEEEEEKRIHDENEDLFKDMMGSP